MRPVARARTKTKVRRVHPVDRLGHLFIRVDERRFFAAVLFTCKKFDEKAALDFAREFFGVRALEHRAF